MAGKKKGLVGTDGVQLAELASFYGAAVCSLDPWDRATLVENLPRVQAKHILDQVRNGAMDLHPDRLYDVALLATGDEEVANTYRIAAIRRRWKR